MRPIINFEEFVKLGIVKKQSIDKPRAEFLIKESGQNYEYLLKLIKTMGIDDLGANDYVKKCYDILMELTRAKMLLEGYNASGNRAHEAEVSYLRRIGLKENEVQFIDQMRFFRNGMLYYGTILDKEYAEKVIKFTKGIYFKLSKIIK
ncbi:hypothetical protein HYV50_00995 [Candidatus Pacearchaeota archaeon]|nr:hypothetical protein [Candidatus Pacearchaeota archaeon]